MIIDGQDYGVQPFIVQIRDIDTHKPLKGVEVGDIGPKYGFNFKDNGYCILNNIRVPRRNMLMRFVKVDKQGNITMQGNPKIVYAVMMITRLQLLHMTPHNLSKALTIGIRYGIKRTQFKTNSDGSERKIIDYQTH